MIPSLVPPESWWCLFGRQKVRTQIRCWLCTWEGHSITSCVLEVFYNLVWSGGAKPFSGESEAAPESSFLYLRPWFPPYPTPVPNPDAALCCCSSKRFSWGFQTSSSISRNWNRHSSFPLEALTRAVGEGFVLHIKDFTWHIVAGWWEIIHETL